MEKGQGAPDAALERKWYLKTVDELLSELQSAKHGLTEEDAARRLAEEGPNVIASEEGSGIIRKLLSEFNSLLILILAVSSFISLFSGHLVEFWVILIIIFITVFTGFIQQQKASKAIEALHRMTPKKVFVLRDGRKRQISWEDIVTGDIVLLDRGMTIPADLRIIESHELMINESILTGESKLKYKHSNRLDSEEVIVSDRDNMAFGGTSIAAGSGRGIVVEKGLRSQLGIISLSIKSIQKLKSPLQKKVDTLSKSISFAVILAAMLLLVILATDGMPFAEMMILVGAVLVSGIPESFPLALTLSLTKGVVTMARHKAIIKDLGSVETLGTTTVICTDKTGTLTQNKMVVERFILGMDKEYIVEGKGYEPSFKVSFNDKEVSASSVEKHSEFFRAMALCSNSEIYLEKGEWKLMGDPTEGSLLALAKSLGYHEDVLREYNPRKFEVPFDPSNKYMAVISRTGNTHTAYLKGALEKVIARCSHVRLGSTITRLNKKQVDKILAKADAYSSNGLRGLAVASKTARNPLDSHDRLRNRDMLARGFVFEGMVFIDDPLREDAFGSVRQCQEAGIRVVMITGDHKKTAENIGRKLSLYRHQDDMTVSGHELDLMSDEELDKIIKRVAVFARTTPEHKLRIVASFQRSGEIVAMTGDGVNDAPALKQADIGIAMGLSGTDVARESSNMILADDNFSSIVAAVKEGRTIYSNIRRFIYYLLTGNFTEVLLIIVAAVLGLLTPLTAIMVLFINLVTSTFPAMALGIEPTHDGVMRQKPRNPRERLLSNYVILKILVLIPLLLFGSLSLFLWQMNFSDGNIEKARTLVFASIILFELFHVFNVRSLHESIFRKSFFNNRYIFISVGISLILMILAIYTDIGQLVFSTVPLNGMEWAVLLFMSSLIIFVTEIIKLLVRSEISEQLRMGKIRHVPS